MVVSNPQDCVRPVRRLMIISPYQGKGLGRLVMLYRENKIGAFGFVEALNHELCSASCQPNGQLRLHQKPLSGRIHQIIGVSRSPHANPFPLVDRSH